MRTETTSITRDTNKSHPLFVPDFKMADLLKLDKYFAPQILLLLYWPSMVVVILSFGFLFLIGILGLFSAEAELLNALLVLMIGLLGFVFGPLYLRLFFELMAVRFK